LGVVGEKIDTLKGKGEDLLSALKDHNRAYSDLLFQRQVVNEVIEDVVTFQNGGLNTSVDTMTEVVNESNRARDDIRVLRTSSQEIRSVLTSKKTGQIPLKDLWFKKVELTESLRILKDLEILKEAPIQVQRMMQEKRYLAAVSSLQKGKHDDDV
jgi:hypothetical protein